MLTKQWQTSSRSGPNGNCVEVRAVDGRVEVRDTKNREGGTLAFDPHVWQSFVDDTKGGAFDL